MKLHPKPRVALLVVSLLFFYSLRAFAQYPGMAAVRAQQNQQFMNQQMQMQMNMQMQMSMNRNWKSYAGEGGRYTLTLKDSTTTKVTSYIFHDSILRKNFLVYEDDEFAASDSAHHFKKIYPDQTINITALTYDDIGGDVPNYGVPTDTGWIFRMISGPITVYAKSANYLMFIDEPTLSGGIHLDFASSEIIGIRNNDGPIEKLTKENLLKIIAIDPKAVKLLDKKGMYEAVKKYNKDSEKTAKK